MLEIEPPWQTSGCDVVALTGLLNDTIETEALPKARVRVRLQQSLGYNLQATFRNIGSLTIQWTFAK
jgi:hypothetical protein